jgi:hypothetical protein
MAHFYFRGPLPADSKLFVGRQEELEQARELCRGPLRSYVILVGATQTGKTSFLHRLHGDFAGHNACVLINLQVIPGATPAGLFRFMATELVKQLELPEMLTVADNTISGPKFEQLLAQLPDQVGKVTILMDEVAALPGKTAIYMANVLRAVFNDRLLPGFEALERFVFLLAGGSELLNLTMTEVSPFSNIATRIFLPDLSLTETKQLIAYGFAGTDMKVSLIHEIAEVIYAETHGHPYLTQRMAAYVAEYAERAKHKPGAAYVAKAREAILENDVNIRHVCKDLQDPPLLDAAFRIQQKPTPFKHLSSRQERLHLLGIIREQDGMAVLRNALYGQVVTQMAEEIGIAQTEAPPQNAAPQVHVKLLTRVLPTAFCHNLTAEEFPLVQLTVDNAAAGSKTAQLYMKANIEGYSDEAVSSVTVAAGERAEVTLLPNLQQAPSMTLTEIRPATLRVTVRQVGAVSEVLILDQTYAIKLHAYDTALLAVAQPDENVVDLTEHLSAFVTPHEAAVEQLLRKAAEYHPKRHIVGYQGASNVEEARQVVREQVKSLYDALKREAGLVYVNSPLNFGKQEGQITQRVRLPSTSLHESKSQANCIDGAVLYASLLELASIDPLIVIVPGHAFIGWRIWRGLDQYDFLETTMTGSEEFEAALKTGNQEYEQARTKGYFERSLFDANGFARLIDVAACRARQIYPLV